jgi:signal transduction histidine kinase
VKLLNKSTLYFFVFLIFTFVVGGNIFYSKAKSIIYQQIDSSLVTEKNIIEEEFLETNEIPDFTEHFFEHQIKAETYEYSVKDICVLKDTSIFNNNQENTTDYRMLEFWSNTKNGKGYLIRIIQSVESTQDLLRFIGLALFLLFCFLLLLSLLINYGVSKNLWSNFNESLEKISKFDISSDNSLNLSETNIKEFRQLNTVLTQMAGKMQNDYSNLKEFNENASHEIQSPLAIIRTNLELLFQNENLNETQLKSLNTIADTVNRLSKLNQGLLLISKIDNQQFRSKESISINTILEKLLGDFEEIINLKNIRIEKETMIEVHQQMNTILAEILISNLISNAVRYNTDGGLIRVRMSENSLSIINTGIPLKSDPEKLFERFRKENHSSESVGLGLSIVKRIADYYGMQVYYKNEGNLHEISISFLSSNL